MMAITYIVEKMAPDAIHHGWISLFFVYKPSKKAGIA